jgi:hypothetical protein
MIAVRTFLDELSTFHILQLTRWEWSNPGSQRSNLTSSDSSQKRRGPKDTRANAS